MSEAAKRTYTDTDRLDFIAHCLEDGGCANFRRESQYSQHAGEVCLFTIPSQHVFWPTVRGAIDRAMDEAEARAKLR